MAFLLDHIGSTVIGGFVILILVGLTLQMDQASQEVVANTLDQSQAADISLILEHDLYKVGYRVAGEKILHADSTLFRFKADLENDGSPDNVLYEWCNFMYGNPRRALERTINSDPLVVLGMMSSCKFVYADSTGATLPYSSLGSSSARSRIKTITVVGEFRSELATQGETRLTKIRRTIRPSNL